MVAVPTVSPSQMARILRDVALLIPKIAVRPTSDVAQMELLLVHAADTIQINKSRRIP